MEDEKSGRAGARKFLENAIQARKIRDEIERFGEDELPRVVKVAKKLGYNFETTDLEAVLREDWGEDEPHLRYFCYSEPPLL